MGTLSRTITCTQSSASGYKKNTDIVYFNTDISAGTAYDLDVSKITLTISNFKSWDVETYYVLRINGYEVAWTGWQNPDGTLHSFTEDCELDTYKNLAINGTINEISIRLRAGKNSGDFTDRSNYFYKKGDSVCPAGSKLTIVAEGSYSAGTAPTTVKLNGTSGNINVLAGSTVTLSWSGASGGGTNNPITGYKIYKNGVSYTTVNANTTSCTVDCPSAGSTNKYTVQTICSRESSGQSVERSVFAYSNPSAPTTVQLNGTGGDIHVLAGSTITLSWSGASGGGGNAITGYEIFKGSTSIGTVASNVYSKVVDCPTAGNSLTYKVKAKGTYSNSGDSVTRTVYAYSNPTAPSTVKLNNIAGNINVLAGTAITLSWSGASAGAGNAITGYEIFRGSVSVGSVASNVTSMAVECPAAGSTYSYKVRTKGTYSNAADSTTRNVYAYTNPTAPTTVTVNPTVVDAGATATLSWSGASNGTGNAITAYKVLRSTTAGGTYTQVGSNVSGTSATVTAHSTMGSAYYFKVQSVGTYSNSGQSSSYATLTSRVYSAVGAPTSVSCSPNVVVASSLVTLSWSGASGGTNTSVSSYQVYRSSNSDSGYTLLLNASGTSASVSAPTTAGQTYYFKIKSIANKSGFDSDLSSAYGYVSVPEVPNAPIIQGTTNGKSYNARPRVLATVPQETVQGVIQSVVATGWTTSRYNLSGGQKVVLRKDTAYSVSGSDNVVFSSRDSFNVETGVTVAVKHQFPLWTDDPVETGTTAIKAVHMNELRQAIDDIRAWYGMPAYVWSEEIIAGVTSSVNWASHAIEIKEQIEEIQAFVNNWDITNKALDISLPTISTFYAPKAEVINKLREAVMLL